MLHNPHTTHKILSPKLQRGFTIIETLVAITILMVAISGPLTIAHKGLTAAVTARDQVVASYLAQDAVEFIRNIKDVNVTNNISDWLTGIGTVGGVADFCAASLSRQCTVDTTTTLGNVSNTGGASGQRLYRFISGALYGAFTHTSSGTTPTQFYRYYTLDKDTLDPDNQVRLVVTVYWQNGSLSDATTFTTYLYKISR